MDDEIKVTPQDIATQQAIKKAPAAPDPAAATEPVAKPACKKPGRKPVRAATAAATQTAAMAAPSASPVDLIDKALDLPQLCGGVTGLKRLVDRLADMERW
jgi:hypothetical protein